MMPIVIQLQSSVRCISDGEILEGAPERERGEAVAGRALSTSPAASRDAWLRGVVFRNPHLNVLVQCSDVSVASAFGNGRLYSRGCAFGAPGLLHLPEDAPRAASDW